MLGDVGQGEGGETGGREEQLSDVATDLGTPLHANHPAGGFAHSIHLHNPIISSHFPDEDTEAQRKSSLPMVAGLLSMR